ncbi:hypothetical protein [Arcobacter sp. CECT 8985]|uniref:hypothetical protein n=1 Tax=Arcobacter sp. CECT 8985 TaxID=1935424 RepID=UPI00100AA5F5|nr:hypothetical protein [Arcobacter sp. CECT 8985]RXJ86481.1 hypothetical protein CRU93_08645 [Arcobacter sp. CECT 8985]
MEEKLLTEAYKLRFEYFNLYENKQEKWHQKYKNHKLYELVNCSFDYNYRQIGQEMPKLIKNFISTHHNY